MHSDKCVQLQQNMHPVSWPSGVALDLRGETQSPWEPGATQNHEWWQSGLLRTIKGQLYFLAYFLKTVCLMVLWERYGLFVFMIGTSLFCAIVVACGWRCSLEVLPWTTLYINMKTFIPAGLYIAWPCVYGHKNIPPMTRFMNLTAGISCLHSATRALLRSNTDVGW